MDKQDYDLMMRPKNCIFWELMADLEHRWHEPAPLRIEIARLNVMSFIDAVMIDDVFEPIEVMGTSEFRLVLESLYP